jgi:hypothetical protein
MLEYTDIMEHLNKEKRPALNELSILPIDGLA